jgi:dCMP deaminase
MVDDNNIQIRMSKTDYYLGIAFAVSKRSTCLKRHYGAVIVNND